MSSKETGAIDLNSESALKEFAISCAFQPIVNVSEKQVFSYEALLRSTMNESSKNVFEKVKKSELLLFDQRARNIALEFAGRLNVNSYINLNFLPRSLQTSDKYIQATLEAATRFGLRPTQLVVEITETEAIHDQEIFLSLVNDLRSKGLKIAIDDFGAGYSGLNLLANFQPDMVKLDMQLVRNIESHGPRQAIVKAITQVCVDLGIDLIAEGVETLEEYHWLREHNICLLQGFLFAKPGFECLPEVFYPD